MTTKECYDAMGGDYEDVMSRLMKEERVAKFLQKVLADKSYSLLCSALEEKNMPEAFRAAHTLKGVSQNLSITRLGDSSAKMTELLRNRESYGDDIEEMFKQVTADYELTCNCIRKYMEEKE
jgi:HPt (histidine-containing phosphotransfer) domain-containing protein